MLKYCPNPAFDGLIGIPAGCNLDAVLKRFTESYKLCGFRYWLWRRAVAL